MRKLIFAIAFLLISGLPKAGQAAIIIVDDDGPADFHNIQDAITYSSDGDTIIVKPGTYTQNLSYNHKAVTVTSQNPNDPNTVQTTIIWVSSGHGVTFDSAEDGNSVITGFTIKATAGRGIYCYGTSPTISKNVIKNCASSGIYGEPTLNAAPIISGNTITSNGSYGIYFCNGPITDNPILSNNGGIGSCNGPITDNIISNNRNTAPGIGGGLYDCHGEITGNYIAYNYASSKGGGLYFCSGDINYNAIVGNKTNSSDGGGLYNCDGSIGNNIISGNLCDNGGGLSSCDGTIYNNTIVGNRAYRGGGIYACAAIVRNNILAFNEAIAIEGGGGIYGLCQQISYNAFSGNVGGNISGGAVSGTGDIFPNDPLFATNGWWYDPCTPPTPDKSDDIWNEGDYHVKSQIGRWDPNNEIWVTDSETSPCIDAGDPNSDWRSELWPHGKRINMGAYGGTPEASMSPSLAGNVADIDDDGWVDFNDMLLLTEMWLSDEVLLAEDLNRDRIVNLVDFAILAGNWQPGPPMPNPMTWATPPYATSPYSIAMTATTATTTDWSGVEYYFEDFQHPQSNSGWLSFAPGQQPMWENTGLTPSTEYRYRVKARNKLNLQETGWSQVASATTVIEDTTKPTPDPMTWETEPCAISSTSIRMVATTADDDSGVQYFFECTSDSNYSSPSWQDSPTYEATSLPKGIYTFVVRAQDKSPNHNTTNNSTAVPVDLKPPTPDPMTWETEPNATSPTSIRMVATTADDYSGVQYFFECTSDSNYSSLSWQDSPTYELTSLPPAKYTFVVRAKDNSPIHNTTGDSNAVTVDLEPPTPDPMTWETEPNATSPTSISMVATTATDDSGVQYFFECTNHNNYSSNWRDIPTYDVNSLPKGVYTFVVRAQDKSPNHNTTGDSNAVTVDLEPPTPDPMTWAAEPCATSPTSIRMVATTASDDSGGVQYFFQCTSDANYSSPWQDSPIYQITSLSESVYTFVVRAQDKSPTHNTTGNSKAVTVDLKPPNPDPMTWAAEPCATSPTSIRMVATTATDYSGVQYFFECTDHNNYSSPWQDSSTYELTSLPKGVYTFVVRAQDKSSNHNTTGNSTAVTVDLEPPTPDPMQWAPNGEPHATSSSSISMVAATASDSSGVQYFFECTSDPNYSSPSWQNKTEYTRSSLPKGIYTFVTRARDKSPNHNTTGNSNAFTVDLTPPTPDPMQWATGGEPKKVDRGGSFNWWAVMTAAEATDDSGSVEYFFKCTNNSDFDSGWQSSRYYEVRLGDWSVIANFKVRARDPSGNVTGWNTPADQNAIISNGQTTKCTVTAGSKDNSDKISISGQMEANEADFNDANKIRVTINSNDMVSPCIQSFPINETTFKKGKYKCSKTENSSKTSFTFDTKTSKFSFTAKNVDLSGLGCPLTIEIKVGDYTDAAEVNETIVNGPKKPIPIKLMMGVKNALRVDSDKVKRGKKKPNTDQLTVKGGFAVEDPNVNLVDEEFVVTLGEQTFTLPAGSFKANKKKDKFTCSKVKLSDDSVATADFNFKTCSFTMTIKNTEIVADAGTIYLGLEFADFDESVPVVLP